MDEEKNMDERSVNYLVSELMRQFTMMELDSRKLTALLLSVEKSGSQYFWPAGENSQSTGNEESYRLFQLDGVIVNKRIPTPPTPIDRIYETFIQYLGIHTPNHLIPVLMKDEGLVKAIRHCNTDLSLFGEFEEHDSGADGTLYVKSVPIFMVPETRASEGVSPYRHNNTTYGKQVGLFRIKNVTPEEYGAAVIKSIPINSNQEGIEGKLTN